MIFSASCPPLKRSEIYCHVSTIPTIDSVELTGSCQLSHELQCTARLVVQRRDLTPILRAWYPHEARKARQAINHTLQQLGERLLRNW